MSKLGSKEEILSAIQSHFENIQSGNLTADEMESLVELTRELHERALILRYKSYEEKVFGVASASTGSASASGAESFAGDGEPSVSDIEQDEPTNTAAETAEAQHSMGFEEVETAILAAEPSIAVEEPLFDFDMFERAEAAASTASTEAQQPTEQTDSTEAQQPIGQTDSTEVQQAAEQPALEEELTSAEAQPADSNENESIAQAFNFAEPSEATKVEETVQQGIELPRSEEVQIAHEIEESPATVSEQMPISPQASEPVQREAEIPLPEELAIMNEPVIVPEKEPEVHQPEANDMFSRFSNNSSNDGSLSSRLSATKLHTLAGAFGLNEKLQCIRELFKGSSEAFK